METSEKRQSQAPRVLHGPHRICSSGVAAQPVAPVSEVTPTIAASEFEIVEITVEIPVELIPLDEPK